MNGLWSSKKSPEWFPPWPSAAVVSSPCMFFHSLEYIHSHKLLLHLNTITLSLIASRTVSRPVKPMCWWMKPSPKSFKKSNYLGEELSLFPSLQDVLLLLWLLALLTSIPWEETSSLKTWSLYSLFIYFIDVLFVGSARFLCFWHFWKNGYGSWNVLSLQMDQGPQLIIKLCKWLLLCIFLMVCLLELCNLKNFSHFCLLKKVESSFYY